MKRILYLAILTFGLGMSSLAFAQRPDSARDGNPPPPPDTIRHKDPPPPDSGRKDPPPPDTIRHKDPPPPDSARPKDDSERRKMDSLIRHHKKLPPDSTRRVDTSDAKKRIDSLIRIRKEHKQDPPKFDSGRAKTRLDSIIARLKRQPHRNPRLDSIIKRLHDREREKDRRDSTVVGGGNGGGTGLFSAPATISPNPAMVGQEVRLTFSLAQAATVQLRIGDRNGLSVYEQTQDLVAGEHTVSMPALPAGAYYIMIAANGQMQSLKLLVQ